MSSFFSPKFKNVPVGAPAPNDQWLYNSFQEQFATGGKAGTNALATSVGALTDAAKGQGAGGMSDVSALFGAIKDASQRQFDEGSAAITEKFGASGLRYSSDMMRSLTDFNIQRNKDLTQTLADLTFKSTESAKQRQLQAAGILEETGSNAALAMHPTSALVQMPSTMSGVIQGIEGAAMIASLFI